MKPELPGSRQRLAVAFPQGYYNIANGFLNGLLGGNGFDVFTLVIFDIGVARFAAAVRTRRAHLLTRRSRRCGSSSRVVLTAVVDVMWFAYKLSERGLPGVLILLAILVIVFGTLASSTEMFGATCMRSVATSPPPRCPASTSEGHHLVLRQHGSTCGCCGRCLLGSYERRAASARNMFEARRHRRLLHRWCVDDRWYRTPVQPIRWPHHGCHV